MGDPLALQEPPSSCPFCGEMDCQLYHRRDERVNEKGERYGVFMWRIRCWSCFAEGPADVNGAIAARKWEARFPKRPNKGWRDDDDGGPPTPVTPKLPETAS